MAYNKKAVDEAIAALIGSGGPATARFQYKPGTITYTPTPNKAINLNAAKTTNKDLGGLYKATKKKNSKNSDPWWKDVLNGMNGVGGSVTNQVANWTDGKGLDMRDFTPSALAKSQWKSWTDGKLGWDDLAGSGIAKAIKKGNKKDIPGYETAANVAKGQAKAWTDGELGFKDIPGFGGLVYAGKKNKGTEQILENAGWKDKKGLGLHDVASFAGDVLLDPTTYLTFGGASALKAGQGAAKNAAKKIGLDEGLEKILKGVKGGSDEIAHSVGSKIYDDIVKKYTPAKGSAPKINQELAERLASKKYDKAVKDIMDAASGARYKNQNNLFNFDIPFTNITAGTGSLPDFMKKVDAKVGKNGGNVARDMMKKYGLGDVDISKTLKKNYNVSKPEELSSQALKHLQTTLKGVKPASTKLPSDPLFKPASNVGKVEKALDKNKFVQDMGGKSPVGKYLADKLFSFVNARSLGSADDFINQQAGYIADADTFIRGNHGKMQSDIAKVEKMAKKLSESDMKMIPYMIEKKYPGKMSAQEFMAKAGNLPQLQKVAAEVEKVLEGIKKRGVEGGTLSNPIQNYFPHMVNKLNNDPEAIQAIMSDPNIQKLLNSSKDKFNQSRKSFDSFASWKDAISELSEVRKGLTDPEDIANIDAKIGQLNDLFEENPIKAVQERYKTNIRSLAMKDMYNNFRSDGTLIARDSASPAMKTSGEYHPLSKDEAGRLGMQEGDLIHKEVMDGLKKVDSIFTDKGINNVVESMNAVTGIWKSLVTTFVPTHHLYNLVGNVANNAMVGVTPAMYTKAGKLLAKSKAGKLSPTEEKVMQKAYDYGVLGGGYKADRFDPIRQQRLKNSKLARIEDKVQNSRFSNVMNGAGNMGDDLTRMALFLHGTNRAGNMKGGGEMVRKYLYNYGEQTGADKVLKIGMPFWNWTKNNVPRQLMEFMQQPRYYATFQKFQEMLSEDRPGGPTWTEDYLQYGDKKFWNMRLPLQDLTGLGSPLDTALNSMNPMAKIPIEMKMNKQFFNDQPIDWAKRDSETPYSSEALAKYFTNQAGMVGKGYDAVTNDKSWLEDLRNIFIGKPIEVK
jgi:hypothetical protein